MKGGGLVLGASLGHTKIVAKAVGIHPSTGQKVLYSQVIITTIIQLQILLIVINFIGYSGFTSDTNRWH